MSALPNPLNDSFRKPIGRAVGSSKLNQYGRDPKSKSEQMRNSSDYDKETGYAPLYHAFFADLCRLSSGQSCMALILLLWDKSAGRGMKKGQPRPEWTSILRVEDLAQICRCDVRTVERELAALDKRGLAEIRRPGKGEVEARLNYRVWETLPDYKSAVIEMPDPEDEAETEAEGAEAKAGNQAVTGKRPVRLAAGKVSKVFPVSCGVKTFRHKAEGPVDLEFSCVIQAGELLVVSRVPDEAIKKLSILQSRSNVFNENTSFPRHGCRGESDGLPTNVGSGIPSNAGSNKSQSGVVNHPRAAELVNLFDDILAGSHAAILSSDSVSLLAACGAVADCDHDYLVKFVIQRAACPVKSPKHVAKICGDALKSWQAGGSAVGLPVAKPKSKPGFAEGVLNDVARRLARDGKV